VHAALHVLCKRLQRASVRSTGASETLTLGQQNWKSAVRWLKLAADQGDLVAHVHLAVCYIKGEGVHPSMHRAFELIGAVAEKKQPTAQFVMGWLVKVPGDELDIVRQTVWAEKLLLPPTTWFERAAKQGDKDAMFALGLSLLLGLHCEASGPEAASWLRYAARQRHCSAEFELGLLFEAGQFVTENPNEAIRLFQRAASGGEVAAMVKLAEYYHDGSVVAGDPKEVFKWSHKAAELGNVHAEFLVGYCYDRGIGVPHDLREAARHYRRAAHRNSPHAQLHLAIMQVLGSGVRKVCRCSALSFELSSNEWLRWSSRLRAHHAVVQDVASAVQLLTSAAEAGLAQAQYNLAVCYEYGMGTRRDIEAARTWYH
jgi:TPR repeat protein